MITLDDIANVSFRKAKIGGYFPEDVDAFIDDVQSSFDQLLKEKAELMRKLEILAKKVEEYREEEESIRNTLLSAQKLADASVREAKHKAEVILKDATASAEKIISNAQNEVVEQQETMAFLQKEVASFRSRLLKIYREHLTLIDALPTEDSVKQKGKAEQPEPSLEKEEPVETEEPPKQPVEEKPAEEISSSTETEGASVDEASEKAEDGKFGVLKFGEDYDLSEESEGESPLGLFKRKK